MEGNREDRADPGPLFQTDPMDTIRSSRAWIDTMVCTGSVPAKDRRQEKPLAGTPRKTRRSLREWWNDQKPSRKAPGRPGRGSALYYFLTTFGVMFVVPIIGMLIVTGIEWIGNVLLVSFGPIGIFAVIALLAYTLISFGRYRGWFDDL